MPLDDAVRYAAERNGVQQDFRDIFGHRHFTEPETNRAILTALGLDCASEDSLCSSLAAREAAEQARLLPPVFVVGGNEPPGLVRAGVAGTAIVDRVQLRRDRKP